MNTEIYLFQTRCYVGPRGYLTSWMILMQFPCFHFASSLMSINLNFTFSFEKFVSYLLLSVVWVSPVAIFFPTIFDDFLSVTFFYFLFFSQSILNVFLVTSLASVDWFNRSRLSTLGMMLFFFFLSVCFTDVYYLFIRTLIFFFSFFSTLSCTFFVIIFASSSEFRFPFSFVFYAFWILMRSHLNHIFSSIFLTIFFLCVVFVYFISSFSLSRFWSYFFAWKLEEEGGGMYFYRLHLNLFRSPLKKFSYASFFFPRWKCFQIADFYRK